MGGVVQAKAKMNLNVDLINLTCVTPLKIFGANFAFGAVLPVGGTRVRASATAIVPKLTLLKTTIPISIPVFLPTSVSRSKHQSANGIADMLIAPCMLGWHYKNFHSLLFLGGFLPTGKYNKHHIANMGTGHGAIETDFGVTWLSPELGSEVSVYTGLTMNLNNHKLHYKSGTEWHTEFFLGQNFTCGLEVGFAGYYYKQITGDYGKGAVLGGFRGRVFGIGPALLYTFKKGTIPITTNLRYYCESSARNHFRGHSVYLTVALPIAAF